MQIKVKRKDLQAELTLLRQITDQKSSIPILANVLCEANGSLRLAATDLDVSLRSSCSAEVERRGRVGLPARKLTEIVKSLSGDDIVIDVDGESWATITCERAKFRIAGIPADDYPALPEAGKGDVVDIPAAVLKDLIERTAFAITNEDARYYLAGALVILEPTAVTMVATDGHSMAYAKRACELKGVKEAQRLLVPRKTVLELEQLAPTDGTVALQQNGSHQLYTLGGRILTTKTIEGNFPAFEKVIDVKAPNSALVDRAALESAVRRVSLLSSERSRAIKLSFETGAVIAEASSPDAGSASESVPAEYKGAAVAIGFAANYVLDFLGASDAEQISVSLKDAESQAIFKPADGGETDYKYVVMPLRI